MPNEFSVLYCPIFKIGSRTFGALINNKVPDVPQSVPTIIKIKSKSVTNVPDRSTNLRTYSEK